jgi:hypothetical protein
MGRARDLRGLSLLCWAIVSAAACGSGSPTSPTTASNPGAQRTTAATLSGQVFELIPGGRVPAGNIALVAVVVTTSGCSPPCVSTTKYTYESTTTAPDGRYDFAALPSGSAVILTNSPAHQQVCGAGTELSGTATLDVEITSKANPQPSPTMPPLRVTGQVYEMARTGRVGVRDAWIALEHHAPDAPFLTFYTGADGRYTMCGIPPNWQISFDVGKTGYDGSYAWHTFTGDMTLDIELRRH